MGIFTLVTLVAFSLAGSGGALAQDQVPVKPPLVHIDRFPHPATTPGKNLGPATAAPALAGEVTTVLTGEPHAVGVPVLNSRPGAAYTVYLDFAGFNYPGTWFFGQFTPGNNLGLDNTPAGATMSATCKRV